MRRQALLASVCVALVFLAVPARQAAGAQGAQAKSAASEAAAASPELVGQLSSAMGSTRDQAAGAAGALFGLAKSRLKADQFGQVAKAVPGMDLLLRAAPAAGGSGSGASAALSQLGASAGGLAAATSAFSKLGLSPDLVSKAIPVLTSFVTKSGGANVGSLLAGVLK